MKDWIQFRTMWTPTIVLIVFIVGSVVLVLIGLLGLITGEDAGERLAGLAFIVFGPLVLRLYCEWIIIAFKIHEAIEDVRSQLADRDRAS